MDNMMELGIALIAGVCIGFLLGRLLGGTSASGATVTGDGLKSPVKNWWEIRKTLTGTQLQILQYMEEEKEVTMTSMQEKFSFIPDRELFYRLEQICLMDFLMRDRKDGEVSYRLNPEYSVTVEEDKTVVLPS